MRYKRIVEELYVISHQIHTSYLDLLQITPREKDALLRMIEDESNRQREALERAKTEREARKNGR